MVVYVGKILKKKQQQQKNPPNLITNKNLNAFWKTVYILHMFQISAHLGAHLTQNRI